MWTYNQCQRVTELLKRAALLLDGYVDVVDDDEGGVAPNWAMSLKSSCENDVAMLDRFHGSMHTDPETRKRVEDDAEYSLILITEIDVLKHPRTEPLVLEANALVEDLTT